MTGTDASKPALLRRCAAALTRPVLVSSVLAGAVYLGWRTVATGAGADLGLFLVLLTVESFLFVRYAMRAVPVALGSRRRGQQRWNAETTAMIGIVVTDEAISQVRLAIRSAQSVQQGSAVVVVNAHGRADVTAQCARMGALDLGGSGPRDVGVVLWQLVREARDELLCFVPAHVALHPDLLRRSAGHFRDRGVAAVTFPVELAGAAGVAGGAGYRLTSDADVAFAMALDAFDAAAPLAGPLLCRRDALAAIESIPVGAGSIELQVGMALQHKGWTVRVGPAGLARRRAPWSEDRALRDRARLLASRFHLDPEAGPGLSAPGVPRGLARLPYVLARIDIVAPVVRLVVLALPVVVALTGRAPFQVSLLDALTFAVPWFLLAALGRRLMASAGEPVGSELRRGVRTLSVDLHVLRSRGGNIPGEGEAARWQFRTAMGLVVIAVISAGVPFTSFGPAMPNGVKFVVVGSALVVLTLVRDLMWAAGDRERRVLARAPLGAVHAAGERAAELSPLGVDIADPSPFTDGERVQIGMRFPLPGRLVWEQTVPAVITRSRRVGELHVAYAEFEADAATFDELLYYCSITADASAAVGVPTDPVQSIVRTDVAGIRALLSEPVVEPFLLQ